MVDDMITQKWVKLSNMILRFPSIVGMLGAWHNVLEACQSYERLTIGLTNMYYK